MNERILFNKIFNGRKVVSVRFVQPLHTFQMLIGVNLKFISSFLFPDKTFCDLP